MPKTKQRNKAARRLHDGGSRGPGSGRLGQAAGARPPRRTRPREFPWLPASVAAIFAVVLVVLFVIFKTTATPVAAISCDASQQSAVHYHAHLQIYDAGQPVTVPAFVGITSTCFYWLHTHDSTGIIHIEAPSDQASRTFTLGDFFSIWGQPLDSTRVASASVQSGQHLVAFINGKQYQGDPRAIPLKAHENITLEIVPPQVSPPPFRFPAGL